jgi:hypothetical protein
MDEQRMLTAEALLGLPDASEETELVTIPGVGDVRVRALSLAEHRAMRRDCAQGDEFDEQRWNTLLLMNGLVDPKLTYDQAAQLTQKAVGAVTLLLAAILEISGLTERGYIAKKAVDEAEGSFRAERD